MVTCWPAGDREAAKAVFQLTEDKTAGIGPKMDLAFSLLRYAPAARQVRLAGRRRLACHT